MRFIFLSVAILMSFQAQAAIELGVGLSSATSGRHIPSLAGAFTTPDWAVTGTSTGVSSGYYYHNTYSLSWMSLWNAGDFGWGPLHAGLGAGAFYSKRSFLDEGATQEENKSDFGLGPAFRVQWFFAGPVYTNMEVIFGLRSLSSHIVLTGQDLVTFSIGVSL